VYLVEKIEILQGENSFNLNIETLQKGTYFLEMENGFERSVQKFLVM